MPETALFSLALVGLLMLAIGAGFVVAYWGAQAEAARWRFGARTCTPVASYEDGNAPSYYLVVALDDVQSDMITYYNVNDARTGRTFRVGVVPLELAPPQGGSGTAPPQGKTGSAG